MRYTAKYTHIPMCHRASMDEPIGNVGLAIDPPKPEMHEPQPEPQVHLTLEDIGRGLSLLSGVANRIMECFRPLNAVGERMKRISRMFRGL